MQINIFLGLQKFDIRFKYLLAEWKYIVSGDKSNVLGLPKLLIY